MMIKFNLKKVACRLLFAAAMVGAITVAFQTKSVNYVVNSEIEALTCEEPGQTITCYCAVLEDESCAVNNHTKYVCASGKNTVKCWEYGRNCN